MPAQLFNRQVVVYLGQNTSQQVVDPGGTSTTNVLKVTDLRCRFKVHKDNGTKPNTAEVAITNLNKTHRASVQVKGAPLIIQAGYPDTISTIFEGVVRTTEQRREGADWSTYVHSGDGEVAAGYATLSQSFGAGTPISSVLSALANTLGDFTLDPVDVQVALSKLGQIPGTFTRGYHAHGKVTSMLTTLLTNAGYEWSIQDRRLQILPKNGTTPQQAILISPTTGLIGSPQMAAGDGRAPQKNAGAVKFRCLLTPTIKPGVQVALQSQGLTGVLRCMAVEHRGDTASGDWLSEVEAMPVQGASFSTGT